MSTPSPVHVIARHFARPDTVDAVRTVLDALVAPTRAEPGCLKYELFENVDDPTDFTFVETFADDAALAAHAAAPYVARLAAALAPITARPSDVRRYRGRAA
jgi:quinol monooxygenase YgiN